MGRRHKNTNGFSIIEVVILIVVIVILVALGILFYRNMHKATTPAASSVTTKTESTTDANSSTTVTIKEWGLKFKLTSPPITNAYYTPPNIDAATGLDRIGLGTKATNVELECSDGSKTEQTTFEYVNRSSDKNKVVTGVSSEAKQIGNYYYSIEFAGGAGCDQISTSAPRASVVSKEFEQNFDAGNLVLE